MASSEVQDYYEVLQVSDVAEPETINRVYRMLAQRYHPDNQETGNEARFRSITEAYQVISNPEKRAQYDATNQKRRKERWRLVSGRGVGERLRDGAGRTSHGAGSFVHEAPRRPAKPGHLFG